MRESTARRIIPLPDEIRFVWKPPDKITVPVWVEENVRLPILTSAEPGPLRISRTPYTKGPLLALGSDFIEWIVLVWGRQLGKSQGVQYPYLCYCIDQDPGPAICLLPTIDKAKYTSTKRLQPMFEICESVKKKMTPDPDDYTKMEMQFVDMILSMAWGGSGTQLTTRPARYLFRDEVDELKKAVGEQAIDPMTAIEQTTSNFANRKIIDTSTPTTPEGNIWKELKRCQFVFEFWIPCPHCLKYQILYWDNVIFGEDHDPQVVENMAYYECDICHGSISNLEKIRMLGKGEWRARKTDNVCEEIIKNVKAEIKNTILLEDVLENRHIKKVGFHLPKWYSPFSGGTFGIISKEFLEAKKILDEGDDFAPMRNWRIYNAAIPWEEVAKTQTEVEMIENKINLPPLVCPPDTIAITAGVDPGQGGFWFVILAWRKDYGAHLVQYGFIQGDYDSSTIGTMMDWTFEIKGEENEITGEGKFLHIWRMGIDTGGGQYDQADTTMTEAAYQFIRKSKRPGLYGTKGIPRETFHRIREQRVDKMPGDKGLPIPGGLMLIEINSDAMKDVVWFHLRIEKDKSGRMTFHEETKFDYLKHLLAEEKRLQKDGSWEWVTIRKANHWLDCTVIAFAMADSEFHGGIRLIRPKSPTKSSGQSLNPLTGHPRGDWVKNWK